MAIINDVSEGEYWSAGGQTLLFVIGKLSSKFNAYATVVDLGAWIYSLDYTQKGIARIHAQNFKRHQALYEMALRNRDQKGMDYHTKEMIRYEKLFKGSMDKLGYQY